MGYPDYKRDLLNEAFNPDFILDRYFHSGQSAVFTGANPNEEVEFTANVAHILLGAFNVRIHPMQIVICGSAHLGFSPVPAKLGKSFDPNSSDIDVAVIAPEIFDTWWSELQSVQLSPMDRSNVSQGLFWGFIDPSIAKQFTDHGRRWWQAFGGLRTDRAAGVRGRLYRSFWSMQSYHRVAVTAGRASLAADAKRNAILHARAATN
jgi:hypothetical protein